MTPPPDVPEPGVLRIAPDGSMRGRSGGYDKRLGDLDGVYRDGSAYAAEVERRGADEVVYRVEVNEVAQGPGALIVGTSTVEPGRVGDEFALTRGHLHARADRAELYHCLSGRGVMLIDTLAGDSRAIELVPGDAVHVPGHWVHRSVNVGPEPFVTLFCYAEDAGQDYGLIAAAGGMRQLVVADGRGGWTTRANPDHTGYLAGSTSGGLS